MIEASLSNDVENITKIIGADLFSEVRQEYDDLAESKRSRLILKKWLPASKTLVNLIVNYLPSPSTAQAYRSNQLYTGDMEEDCAKAMTQCDPKGPVMIYVSKMVPTSDQGKFFAFGRIFSGTVETGQEVYVLGANYDREAKKDIYKKKVQKIVVMMGKKAESVTSAQCGNIIAISGLDDCLIKTGTVTSSQNASAIKTMKYTVNPIVKVSVKPKNPQDLAKLIQGMRKLANSDNLVQCTTDEDTGENIIAGSGELHLEICLKDLVNEYAKCELIQDDPIVTYKETVLKQSPLSLAKSSNKLNRIFAQCQPIEQSLIESLEEGIVQKMDSKERSKFLQQHMGINKSQAMKIWGFAPFDVGTNILFDETQGIQYMNEVKDHILQGFQQVTRKGVLCEENMRGVQFDLKDALLHRDSSHRGGGQLTPCARRSFYACQLQAQPALLEPILQVELNIEQGYLGAVYTLMSKKKGWIEETEGEGDRNLLVRAFLPVRESFGFVDELRLLTKGQAMAQMAFDHWKVVKGNVFEKGDELQSLVMSVRKRKGLGDLPELSKYLDKL